MKVIKVEATDSLARTNIDSFGAGDLRVDFDYGSKQPEDCFYYRISSKDNKGLLSFDVGRETGLIHAIEFMAYSRRILKVQGAYSRLRCALQAILHAEVPHQVAPSQGELQLGQKRVDEVFDFVLVLYPNALQIRIGTDDPQRVVAHGDQLFFELDGENEVVSLVFSGLSSSKLSEMCAIYGVS